MLDSTLVESEQFSRGRCVSASVVVRAGHSSYVLSPLGRVDLSFNWDYSNSLCGVDHQNNYLSNKKWRNVLLN